ncbi:MAG: leucine-rich repeat protein [Ruminococcus sp.]|nr:leucine-rich repeat protein [Ruminococcus sp.]
MRKIISAAAAAAVCLSAATAMPSVSAGTVPAGGIISENKVTDSGKCGPNATWNYEGGTLTITGTGNMSNYETNQYVPWLKYKDQITNVVISQGITNIGASAFAGCSALRTITIPSGVTTIGLGAFQKATSLVSVDLPDTLSKISRNAFNQCTSLASVTVRNKDCQFVGYNDTICNNINGGTGRYSGVIYGYCGSTAETFASDCQYRFELIGSQPPKTTTTTTTATTTSTSTTTSTTTVTTTTFVTTVTTTAPPVIKERAMGDVNNDGFIDAVDASAVLAEYASLSGGGSGSFTDAMKKAADIDGNGITDAVDASNILAYYAYLSSGKEGEDPFAPYRK